MITDEPVYRRNPDVLEHHRCCPAERLERHTHHRPVQEGNKITRYQPVDVERCCDCGAQTVSETA